MVISFHGTKSGMNGADAAMVLTAALTMFQRQKKVLIISLCNADKTTDIEMLADAQMRTDRLMATSMSGGFEFEDNGIDALLRQAGSSRLTIEHFDNYVTQLARTKNFLDITPMTTQQDFENVLVERPDDISMILENAGEVYNYVFVLVDSRNEMLVDIVDAAADRIVIAVNQGRKEELPGKRDKDLVKKTSYLVMDYEAESEFSKNFMRRSYGAAKLFVMPHNVLYRDAANDGTLVKFAMRNYGAEAQDVNYQLVKALREMMDHVSGTKESDDDEDEKLTRLPQAVDNDEALPEKKELEPEQFQEVKEEPKKRGFFFGRRKEKRAEAAPIAEEPAQEQPEPAMPEQEPEVIEEQPAAYEPQPEMANEAPLEETTPAPIGFDETPAAEPAVTPEPEEFNTAAHYVEMITPVPMEEAEKVIREPERYADVAEDAVEEPEAEPAEPEAEHEPEVQPEAEAEIEAEPQADGEESSEEPDLQEEAPAHKVGFFAGLFGRKKNQAEEPVMSETEQEETVDDSEENVEPAEEDTESSEPVVARIDEQYDVYGNRIEEGSVEEGEALPEDADDTEEDVAVPEEPAPKKKGFFASLFGRKEKEVPVSEPEDSVYYSTEEHSETEEEDTE